MTETEGQILTVAQMVAAEQALMVGGRSVDELMRIAGRGAGEYVWRLAAGGAVTVLCGPGNNGGDGYVLAELVRERGGDVAVIAARDPATDAARNARAAYGGTILTVGSERSGEVFVDCLFGSGLNRAMPDELVAELSRLASSHRFAVAVDLPSGVESDSGALLNQRLPDYDLTVALGAWKFAHWTMPAATMAGCRRLVGIGVGEITGAAALLPRPRLLAPGVGAHKYTRGLLAVVAGAMPGAALLAGTAAQRSGAGYVKLLAPAESSVRVPADLVVDSRPLDEALGDRRIAALLAGPGLGRDADAAARLHAVLAAGLPTVLDADALVLLGADAVPLTSAILTPHEGELALLEQAFGLDGQGLRRERALALAQRTGTVVVLKGSDSLIAKPDGALVCAPSATSWLSTAGTGDVLAGLIASRLATDAEPFRAACEGLWLHGEAARLAGPGFAAGDLARRVPQALAAALV